MVTFEKLRRFGGTQVLRKGFRASGVLVLSIGAVACMAEGDEGGWRSQLYPADWKPGKETVNGAFLHDFSYAGYRMGEESIPDHPPGDFIDVTESPYDADPTGEIDSTRAIQAALDAAGTSGGGVVFLPEGTYRIRPENGSGEALRIEHDRVVLRGAGAERTFLVNDEPVMRRKAVIRVRPRGKNASWYAAVADSEIALAEDAPNRSRRVKLEETGDKIAAGDWVVLGAEATDGFIRENAAEWLVPEWAGSLPGPAFYRQVVAVDRESNAIELDIPLRLSLRRRDNARLYRVGPHLSEVGIEHISIGMREHPAESGWDFNEYREEDTAAWDVHGAFVIHLTHVTNGWVRNVRTYRPEGNRSYHSVSNVLALDQTRSVTVADCDFQAAQYRGGGGNGYGYVIMGSDNLVRDSSGSDLRYVFDFKRVISTGNVVLRGRSEGRSDFHMHLSAANLIDNVTMAEDLFYAGSRYRWGSVAHGMTTRDTVFWNTRGEAGEMPEIIEVTDQSEVVMVVGTRGKRTGVKGAGDDAHVEGLGEGDRLVPESLYEDQLRRRTTRE